MPERKASSESRKNVIMLDSSMEWARRLHYKEKSSAFELFSAVYWGIYLFAIGAFIVVVGPTISVLALLGWAIMLLAIFLMIYGFVISLHHKFLKRHG